jgi:hypothetical protein
VVAVSHSEPVQRPFLLVHHYYDHYSHCANNGAEEKGDEECRYGKSIHLFGGLV